MSLASASKRFTTCSRSLSEQGGNRSWHLPTVASISEGACEIWSLSPGDSNFLGFLRAVENLLPREGESKTRIPSSSPNDIAVTLWVKAEDVVALLGSDLEKRGWG